MSDDKTKTAARNVLTRYMSQRNMRKTPERYAILDKVFETPDHFFIESLHSELTKDGYRVSRVTVYNTIDLLLDAGLVRRRSFGSGPARYEKALGSSNHHHLVCSRCGKVSEFKDAQLDTLITGRRYGKFQPVYADLYIYGLCDKCAHKAQKAGRTPSPRRSDTGADQQLPKK